MPIFAGFDTDEYPGDETMAALKAETNLAFCGFYLAPAPSHRDTGWMKALPALKAQGWGFLPTFVGQQVVGPGSHLVNAVSGHADGMLAADLMAKAGFDTGCYVYLDLENGPPLSPAQKSYVQAWAAAVRTRQFAPGIYVSHTMADAVAAAVPGARIWAVKVASTAEHDANYGHTFPLVDPHASGYQYAYAWQYEQNARITAHPPELVVDLSVAIMRDPSR